MPASFISAFCARDILVPATPVRSDTACGEAVSHLLSCPDLPGLAVVADGGRPLGLVAREKLLATFAHHLKSELYRRRPISHFLGGRFLCVDAAAGIDEISAMIAGDHPEALRDGFIVTENGCYAGIGTGLGLLSRVVELTRRRAGELEDARCAAEQANRAKSDFLASMSHELRTPLNGVIGNLELLSYAESDRERDELAASAAGAAQTLLQLIGSVLDFSKIDFGRLTLDWDPIQPVATFHEAVATLAPAATQKGLALDFTVGVGIPQQILGDSLRLRQVAMNIIGNAIKFTEKGRIAVALSRHWEGEKGDGQVVLRLDISDTGPGFPASRAETLFDAFDQGDNAISRRYGGTGLGLAISKGLVTMAGGTIAAHGSPGEGATFRCDLPVTVVKSPPEAVPPSLKGIRILLFDGGSGNLAAGEALKKTGASVITATGLISGIAALRAEEALRGPFDVIVLDWQLPDGDSRVIATAVSGQPTRLLVTVPGQRSDVARRALRTGFERVIMLPCPPDEIVAAVVAVSGRLPERGDGHDRIPAAAKPAPPARLPTGLSVLVIDDTDINRTVARRQLAKLGLSCDEAENGAEGLKKATTGRYAAILVDRSMPVMDGNDFTRHWRDWETAHGRPRTPVIAMTAHALSDDADTSYAAGMDDHLTKPVTLDKLASTLQRHLDHPPGNQPVTEVPTEALATPAVPEGPAVDLDRLNAILGVTDDTERHFILNTFVDCFPGMLERIHDAVRGRDLKAVHESAHACKSAASHAAAASLLAVLIDIESDRTSDWDRLTALANAADRHFAAVCAFVEHLTRS